MNCPNPITGRILQPLKSTVAREVVKGLRTPFILLQITL